MEPRKLYVFVATSLLLAVGIIVSPGSAQDDSGEAPSLYYCPDGRPIRQEWLCDGTNDCMDANATDELNCNSIGILIPLVVISIVVLAVLVGMITVAICFLKRQRDAQEQEQSLLRLAFTNPASPTTFNRLKSPSLAPQKVAFNNAIPQPSHKNKPQQQQHHNNTTTTTPTTTPTTTTPPTTTTTTTTTTTQQQPQQQKPPKVITNISKPNIFMEEPEVFELPPTSRHRRVPTPPDSPLLKPSSVPPSTETESEEIPPPRPPKAEKPDLESSRETKIYLEGEIENEVTDSGTHSIKPGVGSTREVKIDLEDDKDTESGTHSLELKESSPDLEQETASADSSHSENTHEDEKDTSC